MTETKQNWEEGFDISRADRIRRKTYSNLGQCVICGDSYDSHSNKLNPTKTHQFEYVSASDLMTDDEWLIDFIRKVCTEAILEERKRIEVEANKLLSSEVYWDGMTFVEQSIVGGNILINNGIKKILKIINNKNI